jgi:predicted transcriptional regulator
MSNLKPTTAVTVTDPKLFERIAELKADTEEIKRKISEAATSNATTPCYFPRGYFP